MAETAYLTPEGRARIEIDRTLGRAGWAVQDASRANLAAARGVAVREFVLAKPHGRVDYLLFVDGLASGLIVDMIATGTDVRPLECVSFMRSVRSRTYFEQMKGRGVRVISPEDFQLVTPDPKSKERFVLVDAVGVTETDLVDTQPLDCNPTVPLERLMKRLSFGSRDPDVVRPSRRGSRGLGGASARTSGGSSSSSRACAWRISRGRWSRRSTPTDSSKRHARRRDQSS